ncbi:unnamed protein product [Orchesella dallaii]|uniref:Uncharacterized protein n=1 Tax=Orchesella dallaii TaxID=48710 RepID=A0ABP1QV73_9HEXA
MSGKPPPNRKVGSKPTKPGCPNAINIFTGRPDAINNNNNAKEQLNPLRTRLSAVLSQPKINLDAEVDRLVGAARVYAEKEKFKLKQFYEEEIKRTKKTVIQEFKCAMEREIISPLKTKLCSYEKEIYNLKGELESACQQRMGSEGDAAQQAEVSTLEKDLLHIELDKAHAERRSLFSVIHSENLRKSVRASTVRGSLFLSKEGIYPSENQGETISTTETTEEFQEGQATVGKGQSRPSTASTVAKKVSIWSEAPSQGGGEAEIVGGEGAEGSPPIPPKDQDPNVPDLVDVDVDENGVPVLGETEVNLTSDLEHPRQQAPRNTFERNEQIAAAIESVNMNINPDEISEETKHLLLKIQELTVSLAESKQFTEEEIADLIKETELVEELRKRIAELEAENEALKKRIEELLAQIEMMRPPRGSIEDENYQLRSRAKELEDTMNKLKTELDTDRDKFKNEIGLLEKKMEGMNSELDAANERILQFEEEAVEVVDQLENFGEGGAGGGVEEEEAEVEVGNNSRAGSASSAKSGKSAFGASVKSGGTSKSKQSKHSKQASVRLSVGEPEPPPPPPKCTAEHPERCSVVEQIEAEYLKEIEELRHKINKTQEELEEMSKLEQRIKELEAETEEMDALRKRIAELSEELEILQNKEPPECPRPSETEKLELQRKLGELETLSQRRMEDYESLQKKAAELEAKNKDLNESVTQLQAANEKAAHMEQLHGQLLEEKRRKSAECNNLALKMREVETQKTNLERELNEKKAQLEELTRELEKLRRENQQMMDEHGKLKEKVESSRQVEDGLRSDLQKKTELLSQLQSKIDSLLPETERLRNEVDSLRKQLNEANLSRSNLEAELAHLKRQLESIERTHRGEIDTMKRRCAEECGELSRKGQCILDHEKKCLALTDQLADDNVQLQERIRQLEQQLEEFYMMEKRTKELQKDMNTLQLRTMERTKELQKLKNMPEACSLDFSMTNPFSSGPGNDVSPWPPSGGGGSGGVGGGKKRNSTQCRLLTAQLADLDLEKKGLSRELDGKRAEIDKVTQKLAGLEEENRRVKGMVNDMCTDAAAESVIVIDERQSQSSRVTSQQPKSNQNQIQKDPYQSTRGFDIVDETRSQSTRLAAPPQPRPPSKNSDDEEYYTGTS